MNLTTLYTLIRNTQFACFDEIDEITMCVDMSKASPDKPYLLVYTRAATQGIKLYEVSSIDDNGTIYVISDDEDCTEITLYATIDKHMITKLAEEAEEEADEEEITY